MSVDLIVGAILGFMAGAGVVLVVWGLSRR
jgi:hypothetical protein